MSVTPSGNADTGNLKIRRETLVYEVPGARSLKCFKDRVVSDCVFSQNILKTIYYKNLSPKEALTYVHGVAETGIEKPKGVTR